MATVFDLAGGRILGSANQNFFTSGSGFTVPATETWVGLSASNALTTASGTQIGTTGVYVTVMNSGFVWAFGVSINFTMLLKFVDPTVNTL